MVTVRLLELTHLFGAAFGEAILRWEIRYFVRVYDPPPPHPYPFQPLRIHFQPAVPRPPLAHLCLPEGCCF